MYQVDLCFFTDDGETREYGEFLCECEGLSREDAIQYAERIATVHRGVLIAATRLRGYDGVSVDVRKMADPEPHAYECGWEVMPGQKTYVWRYE